MSDKTMQFEHSIALNLKPEVFLVGSAGIDAIQMRSGRKASKSRTPQGTSENDSTKL